MFSRESSTTVKRGAYGHKIMTKLNKLDENETNIACQSETGCQMLFLTNIENPGEVIIDRHYFRHSIIISARLQTVTEQTLPLYVLLPLWDYYTAIY